MSLDRMEERKTSRRSLLESPWLRRVCKAKREREQAVMVAQTCSAN